ncbi:MAG: LptF/LptG family permease [Deltaproteobacteria bacterium]|nr:LptF/LptG family permease [Deltaproteobacteria bacterium]
MRILSRYVFARFLTWFAVTFALLCGVAASADLLMEFERVQDLGGEGVQPIVYLLMRLPALHFKYLIPVSTFSAALLTLGTASLGFEIIAAKAGGISPHSLMVPVLAGAAIIAAATWVVNDTLVVRATHYVERPEKGDGPEIVFRGGSFWYHRGRSVYNIRRTDKSRARLYGVTVYERDASDRLVRSVHAQRATVLGADSWRLENAIIRTFQPDRPGETPGFRKISSLDLTVEADPDFGVLEADPAWLSTADLRNYIETQEAEGEDTAPFRAILQQRIAAPLTVFLFALLAIPAALQAERTRSLATPALQGMGLLVLFWFFSGIAGMISARGLAGADWALFAVVAAFLAFGAFRAQRVPA